MPKSKIIELPIVKDKRAFFELINDRIAKNRMEAIFEEANILKYYLNSEYEDALKLAKDENARDVIVQSHQADLEALNTEFSFRISELMNSHQQGNLLEICLKRYGINKRKTPT